MDHEEKTIAVATAISPSSEEGEINRKSGFLGTILYYEKVLDRKLGLESHGPARILPEDRKPPNQLAMAVIWASATMNLSCFTTGFLGWEFGLSLTQTILITIFGSLLGSAVTGWCATLGPGTGLRQVAISRYSFGWWPSKIIAALNVIEQLGWSSVGCITGGLALSAVSDGKVSSAVGVAIIALVGFCFSFFGLKGVLIYEQYAWILFFIVFMVMYGEVAPLADLKSPATVTGPTFSGMVLSLLSVVYGSSASWCSIVSDYYVQYPVNTSKTKVFLMTTFGIAIPTCIGMLLGCCVGSTMGINEEWKSTYENSGVGELLKVILYPQAFAKFLLVLLVLSGIGTNCIAMYSGALSIQLFARPLQVIPRIFWTVIIFACILVIGIAGRDHLLDVLENFLSLLGYWNTAFFAILFLEHYLFRRGSILNYDLEAWDLQSRLPVGIAGLLAFLLGIVGCILGMVETYYVGVIAKMIGDDGGDIGNQLAFVFTILSYIPLRYVERKYLGR